MREADLGKEVATADSGGTGQDGDGARIPPPPLLCVFYRVLDRCKEGKTEQDVGAKP